MRTTVNIRAKEVCLQWAQKYESRKGDLPTEEEFKALQEEGFLPLRKWHKSKLFLIPATYVPGWSLTFDLSSIAEEVIKKCK